MIAVTVLTSLDREDLRRDRLVPDEPLERVLRLARLTHEAGLDGIVCSPQEAACVRRRDGARLPAGDPGGAPVERVGWGSAAVMTPRDALVAGSDYLVIGRPITAADDPLAALAVIEAEIQGI